MHSIDIDALAAQLMQRNVVSQSSTIDISATALVQLCDAVEGALALDESMNFDQDGEARYFGTTSGRLNFSLLMVFTPILLAPCLEPRMPQMHKIFRPESTLHRPQTCMNQHLVTR
ncbi:hypothetical protein LCI18_013083 [Fusarium solani-melongenae]|uniref:Uncharacterized protein n=1 Tax=Fusarium solani subsp. cucurbitae TaxID=2747967 RepID=A0ACD3ZM46_FUSSC|nr:hypothetical protein LCI18_013083 [Fusarium solani-melongenae]